MDLAIDQRVPGNRRSLSRGFAGLGLASVTHVGRQAELLISRRNGRIVTQQGRFVAVHGRWWPHLGNMLQVLWDVNLRTYQTDRCELYYHEPLTSPGFLTLSYVRSGPRTSLSTFFAATLILDEIARLRRANAIVCHVTNDRITDRLLERWGWAEHCLDWPGRHFIKRLYGDYPEIKAYWRNRLTLDRPTNVPRHPSPQ